MELALSIFIVFFELQCSCKFHLDKISLSYWSDGTCMNDLIHYPL
jgi:hypothetical protein